jgi:hypothetical protein
MQLKAGTRLRSQVCGTQLIVIVGSDDDLDLRCGGEPLIDLRAEPAPGLVPARGGSGTQLGKRYVDASGRVELLITKPGAGTLTTDGVPMTFKQAKPLPASD